jgi:RNA polymerase sigma-70 factor (ECF subfamily)
VDTDRALVDAAQTGDTEAIDTLIRRHQVRIFNFARTLTANDADAEDLAQETFVRAFRGVGRFRGDSSFKNWLYTIATNVARTQMGRRIRQAPVWERRLEADEVSEHQLASQAQSVEETVIHREILDRAVSTLPKDLRIALVLRDVEGLEYREIATVLEIPIGTVMSRIFRARKRLRPLLTELQAPRVGEVAL